MNINIELLNILVCFLTIVVNYADNVKSFSDYI